jgi:hypothetical protein
MHLSALPCIAALCLLQIAGGSQAQSHEHAISSQADSDGDGLSDALEQSLLDQFAPAFMIGRNDCSTMPSEFWPDSSESIVKAENGSIYGQVFPAKTSNATQPVVEIHYYHLWKKDCGAHPHALDAEHVSALVEPSGSDLASTKWRAKYWYAAAHENTVCDVSQIARASTLHAEDRGAKIWISPGKHASYLNETLCQKGCGADRCEAMVALSPGEIINLGEASHPMHDSLFTASPQWPLAEKMKTTNFPAIAVARLNQLPESDIAWFHAGKHPAQGVISVSSSTEEALANSRRNTTDAISAAGDSTDMAISVEKLSQYNTRARHIGAERGESAPSAAETR